MRKVVVTLFTILFLACSTHTTVSDMPSAPALEDCFASKLNHERAVRGIPTVPRDPVRDVQARSHSHDMADDGTIYHGTGDDYAENVGMGPDCDSIHSGFMHSAGHRENVLDKRWVNMGIGVVVKGDTVFVTERFFISKPPHPVTHPPARRKSTRPSSCVPR